MSANVTIDMNGTTNTQSDTFFESMTETAGDALGAVAGAFGDVLEGVTDAFGAAGDAAGGVIETAGDFVETGIDAVSSGVADVAGSVPDVSIEPEIKLPFSEFRAEPFAIALGVIGIGGIVAYMATKK